MPPKYNLAFAHFAYGGNGGISSETPDIREWQVPLVCELSRDSRIGELRIFNISDTPITMSRNQAIKKAREFNTDFLVMVDSDMKPDMYVGQDPLAKPFIQSSLEFLIARYGKGPHVIGAPYCGPPPGECVYVFKWESMQSEHPNPDFQLKMYERAEAAKLAGIQECAALPTGLIIFDMRVFDLIEPRHDGDKPFAYYEWKDKYAAEKASTEDVTMTRDMSLVGTQKLGYNPVYCNWDAWAGHWKPKCVGKPQFIDAKHIAEKMKQSFSANVTADTKMVQLSAPSGFLTELKAAQFKDLGMGLGQSDQAALQQMVRDYCMTHSAFPRVVEVGSWAGRSACILADAGATVTCVDHWQGNKNDDGTKGVDAETAFNTFLENTKAYREKGQIDYFKGSSEEAARHYAKTGAKFDIVYIDAEHDYESVKRDIAAWKPLAKRIVSGHDFHSFPGVKKAVSEEFSSFQTQGNVWMAGV
jgi:hypothetical protein